MNQLFEFFSKKFKCNVNSESNIREALKNYNNLNITIWHADTFLIEETKSKHDKIINLISEYGVVKQTGKIKKI